MPSHKMLLAAIAGGILCAGSAQAQYKWIDAQGRIGYGDMPPAADVRILRTPRDSARPPSLSAPADPAGQELPFDLRRIALRAPVTLYTTSNCDPCDLARQHMATRGIPYQEKMVSSTQDILAFARLGFTSDTGLPVLTAGASRELGYHATRWDEAFTRLGYPSKSKLPRTWSAPPAEALAIEAASTDAPALEASTTEPRKELPVTNEPRYGQRRSPTSAPVAEASSVRF